MLTSLALIFLVGLMLGAIFKQLKLPSLIGMILTGIILSPYALNLLDNKILSISSDLRQLALIIILTRAGLALNVDELKKVGLAAILLSFIPATFEIVGVIIIAPLLLGVSTIEAAIIGSVLAAVSPAVVVPRMLMLKENRYGTDKSIPQMIMAAASVDDVYVIVLFTSFLSIAGGEAGTSNNIIQIPLSIITGIVIGAVAGILVSGFYKKFHIRDSAKVIILLSVSFLMITLQNIISGIIPFSGLLAVMSCSAAIFKTYENVASRLSAKFAKLWVAAEVILFVLVGATVDIRYAVSAGIFSVVLIISALLLRMLGVFLCLIGTKMNYKEKLFCMIAYMPKATVQAAIGGVALSIGLPCGNIVLTIAVMSILITAPLGAVAIDSLYTKLLNKES